MAPPNASSATLRAAPWLVLGLVAALVAVSVYGFREGALFTQNLWEPQGQARLIQFAGIFAAAATAVLILVPWLFTRLAAGLLVSLTVALLPVPVLAVSFFLLAAWCLGRGSIVLGIALYLIPMAFLARLPIDYPAVWVVLLALPIAIRRPRLRLPCFSTLPTWPERFSFALLAFVFVIHWFAMLKPEAAPDSLAVHLAVPADIASHHVLTYQPDRFVWAVMPMGGDFVYAIVYQFGGEQGARLLNLALLAVLLGLLHSAVRRSVGPATAWLLLAVFAATPLVQVVTGELFVENLLAVLLLGAFLAVGRGSFHTAAILAGAALSTKLGALPVVILLLIYAAWERPRRRTALVSLVLLVACTIPPYAVAWVKTGNPVFPFLNEKFRSPMLPDGARIRDSRFYRPLTWRTPYNLTFHTDRYHEGQRGSFGFQQIFFAALAIAAALVVRRRPVVAAAGIALGAALLILSSEPNARYLYPELPILVIPVAALMGWADTRHRLLFRAMVMTAVAAAMLNIWFIASGSYWHRDLYGPFTRAQREQYLEIAAPIRATFAWFERIHPGAPVLLTNDTAIAGLSGPVYENQWHQYANMQRIRSAPDAAALRRILDEWQVRFVIARRGNLAQLPRPQTLRDLIAACGTAEFLLGEFYVSRLKTGCIGPAGSSRPAEPEIAVSPGRYDDFDPVLLFRGDWQHSSDFAEARGHTTSYTDKAGAEIALAFEGTEVTWTFARAPNRGIAQVTMDGVFLGEVDLYGPEARWQQSVSFGGLAAGRHLLIVRVRGMHRPEAKGSYVDLDALEVK